VAIGGKWERQKRRNQAKTVAVGCDQLPIGAHGKEGVDGSSPSEGFTKGQVMAFFVASGGTAPPTTCPQELSPYISSRAAFGLSTQIADHRAPPLKGGTRQSGSDAPRHLDDLVALLTGGRGELRVHAGGREDLARFLEVRDDSGGGESGRPSSGEMSSSVP
jgi:hypothetical protein